MWPQYHSCIKLKVKFKGPMASTLNFHFLIILFSSPGNIGRNTFSASCGLGTLLRERGKGEASDCRS